MTLLPKPFRDLLLGSLLTFCLCCSPYQGSRTIRTEEAVLITLARFSSVLFPSASKSTASATGKKLTAPEEGKRPTPDNTPVAFTDDSVSDESSSDDDSDGSNES